MANQLSPTPQAHDGIIDVYATNLEEELENIRQAIELYPFVAMDTEFPGVVARPIGSFKSSSDYHYQTLRSVDPGERIHTASAPQGTDPAEPCIHSFVMCRCNVDLLRIIQLGITLCDENGTLAEPVCTWQFNFRFSLRWVGEDSLLASYLTHTV